MKNRQYAFLGSMRKPRILFVVFVVALTLGLGIIGIHAATSSDVTTLPGNGGTVPLVNQLELNRNANTLQKVVTSSKNSSTADVGNGTMLHITKHTSSDTVTASYSNVGTYDGKAINATMTLSKLAEFSDDHKVSHTGDVDLDDDPKNMAVTVYENFYSGLKFYNIAQLDIAYAFTYASDGSAVNLKQSFLSVFGLNGPNTAISDTAYSNGYEYTNISGSHDVYIPANSVIKNVKNPTNTSPSTVFGATTENTKWPVDTGNSLTYAVSGNSVAFQYGTTRYSTSSDRWSNPSFTISTVTLGAVVPPKPVIESQVDSAKLTDNNNAKAGDDLTYNVDQKVNSLNINAIEKYQSWSEQVNLPAGVTYKSATMTNASGTALPASAYTVSYDQAKRAVVFKVDKTYISNSVKTSGEHYHFVIKTIVNNDVTDGSSMQANATITVADSRPPKNGTSSTSNNAQTTLTNKVPVIIQAVDVVTGKAVAQDRVALVPYGGNYSVSKAATDPKGYVFNKKKTVTTFSGEVNFQTKTVTFYYNPIVPIKVEYIRSDNNKLATKSKLVKYAYGANYKIAKLAKDPKGYVFDSTHSTSSQTGKVDFLTKTIKFYYNPKVPLVVYYYRSDMNVSVAKAKIISVTYGQKYNVPKLTKAPFGYVLDTKKTGQTNITTDFAKGKFVFYYKQDPAKVKVTDVLEGGKKLGSREADGLFQGGYLTHASDYDDRYTLVTEKLPNNAHGIMDKKTLSVTYIYRKTRGKWLTGPHQSQFMTMMDYRGNIRSNTQNYQDRSAWTAVNQEKSILFRYRYKKMKNSVVVKFGKNRTVKLPTGYSLTFKVNGLGRFTATRSKGFNEDITKVSKGNYTATTKIMDVHNQTSKETMVINGVEAKIVSDEYTQTLKGGRVVNVKRSMSKRAFKNTIAKDAFDTLYQTKVKPQKITTTKKTVIKKTAVRPSKSIPLNLVYSVKTYRVSNLATNSSTEEISEANPPANGTKQNDESDGMIASDEDSDNDFLGEEEVNGEAVEATPDPDTVQPDDDLEKLNMPEVTSKLTGAAKMFSQAAAKRYGFGATNKSQLQAKTPNEWIDKSVVASVKANGKQSKSIKIRNGKPRTLVKYSKRSNLQVGAERPGIYVDDYKVPHMEEHVMGPNYKWTDNGYRVPEKGATVLKQLGPEKPTVGDKLVQTGMILKRNPFLIAIGIGLMIVALIILFLPNKRALNKFWQKVLVVFTVGLILLSSVAVPVQSVYAGGIYALDENNQQGTVNNSKQQGAYVNASAAASASRQGKYTPASGFVPAHPGTTKKMQATANANVRNGQKKLNRSIKAYNRAHKKTTPKKIKQKSRTGSWLSGLSKSAKKTTKKNTKQSLGKRLWHSLSHPKETALKFLKYGKKALGKVWGKATSVAYVLTHPKKILNRLQKVFNHSKIGKAAKKYAKAIGYVIKHPIKTANKYIAKIKPAIQRAHKVYAKLKRNVTKKAHQVGKATEKALNVVKRRGASFGKNVGKIVVDFGKGGFDSLKGQVTGLAGIIKGGIKLGLSATKIALAKMQGKHATKADLKQIAQFEKSLKAMTYALKHPIKSGKALLAQLKSTYKKHGLAYMLGHATVDIATTFIPGAGIAVKLGQGAKVAITSLRTVQKLSKAAEGVDNVNKVVKTLKLLRKATKSGYDGLKSAKDLAKMSKQGVKKYVAKITSKALGKAKNKVISLASDVQLRAGVDRASHKKSLITTYQDVAKSKRALKKLDDITVNVKYRTGEDVTRAAEKAGIKLGPKGKKLSKKQAIKLVKQEKTKIAKNLDEVPADIRLTVWHSSKPPHAKGKHGKIIGLKPNTRYTTGEYPYVYETDSFGRIVHVKTNELHVKKHIGKKKNSPDTFDKLDTDEAGHLIGDQFGGSHLRDNLLSQAQNLNQGAYKAMEMKWRDALDATPPKKVSVQIDIEYPKDGKKRPSVYHVRYTINGKRYQRDFKNQK